MASITSIYKNITSDNTNPTQQATKLTTGYGASSSPVTGVSGSYDTPIEMTIRDTKKDTYLVVPVVPKEIEYGDGDGKRNTVDILNLGSVDFANGVELDTCGWSSFFPGRYDAAYCSTPQLKTPVEYRNQFSTWKDEATPLQVIIPAYDINKPMTLKNFKWRGQGFEGDIYYSVEFKERKTVVPKQVTTGGQLPAKGKKVPEERPDMPITGVAIS